MSKFMERANDGHLCDLNKGNCNCLFLAHHDHVILPQLPFIFIQAIILQYLMNVLKLQLQAECLKTLGHRDLEVIVN
jgi:hypothetical protein